MRECEFKLAGETEEVQKYMCYDSRSKLELEKYHIYNRRIWNSKTNRSEWPRITFRRNVIKMRRNAISDKSIQALLSSVFGVRCSGNGIDKGS